jgi:acetyl-CoA C-acetyltransferase
MYDDVVIVAAGRTPVGAFNGSLAGFSGSELGARMIKALLQRAALQPGQIDEVILGQVLQAGAGQNPARQAALAGGLPDTVSALTINKVCGSGLKAVHLAAQAVQCGDSGIVIAGGQESMSQSPHILPRSRDGKRMGNWEMVDTMIQDGLWCAFNDCHMGITAENIAAKYEFSRAEQDLFAATSQQRAEAAQKSGHFDEEIIPVEIPQRKGDPIVFGKDEYLRPGTTADSLGKLKPAFKKEGSVTAGNASGINDGAAGVIVMTGAQAKALGLTPLARVVSFGSAGVDPAIMGTGPIPAVRKCLDKAGWSAKDLDMIEANEAFAAQAMSVNKELGFDPVNVNVSGGAIAIGHPIGASGARILVTLLYGMRRTGAKKGLATLCIGGGQGVALAVERI